MAEIERRRLALFMWPDTIKALREMALNQGFVITAGRGTGQGSVSTFLEALVEGRAKVPHEQVGGSEPDEATLESLFASGDATLVAIVPKGELTNLLSKHDLVVVTSSENVKGQP